MMWAQSRNPLVKGQRRVWHVVTVTAWDARKLQAACQGVLLQRATSAQRTDPPPHGACPRCLHALGRCDATCRVGHHGHQRAPAGAR